MKNKNDLEKKTINAMKSSTEDKLSKALVEDSLEKQMTPKFKEWASLYMDKSNKEYFGNATQCALKAYDTENYFSAAQIGSRNAEKLEIIMGAFLEVEGMGYGEMVKIGAAKMIGGTFADWKELMIMAGFYKPPKKVKEDGGNTFNFDNLNFQFNADRKARGLDQD